ncbi:hypothetical protein HPB48_015600 [Haemaphysalis longicornis]|uniref:Uncharacterized protein n=1 Tax=Haemaphysalis longicornis TaxID=44386 RepID=A0A9J6F8H5_HAELO|nr:hypothetical protein HPB48_015600 [Haemaphysalis longicornis]
MFCGFRSDWFPGWSSHGGYGSQPSDDGLAQQDCIEVRDVFLFPSKGQGHTATFFWNDRHCAVANPFVCQRLREGGTRTQQAPACSRFALSPKGDTSMNIHYNSRLLRDLYSAY